MLSSIQGSGGLGPANMHTSIQSDSTCTSSSFLRVHSPTKLRNAAIPCGLRSAVQLVIGQGKTGPLNRILLYNLTSSQHLSPRQLPYCVSSQSLKACQSKSLICSCSYVAAVARSSNFILHCVCFGAPQPLSIT